MNFTSQICTTSEQSERLLALGLKSETADMHFYRHTEIDNTETWELSVVPYGNVLHAAYMYDEYYIKDYIKPAWSLHRLIEMLPKEIFDQSKQWHLFLSLCYEDTISYEECDSPQPCYLHFCSSDNIYDNIIETIEWLIKESHFNKEYLE